MPYNGQSDADKIKEVELRNGEAEKLPQADPMVVYMTGDQGPFKCANCEYFIEGGACEKVEGEIDPEGCCNLFEKGNVDESNATNDVKVGPETQI